ncbi:MAG: DUF6513 domain-containing protein, partial [Phycisphaeraceae bacterium]|nr:DUF6513 domain-containing protein [Phycisphaeraceae bacterium]
MTGTLAEPAVRAVADQVRAAGATDVCVIVLNIQVAALLTADWVARKLALPDDVIFDRVILPGYCDGDASVVAQPLGQAVEKGPKEIDGLYDYLTGTGTASVKDYGAYDIEIIAEIN